MNILGKKPKYAVSVPKTERISVQMRVMEEIPETKGKLSIEEKEIYAFCVYYITCIQKYDEQKGTVESGLTDFTSSEYVLRLYQFEKNSYPSRFPKKEEKTYPISKDYGYTEKTPIRLTSVHMSYKYLKSLRYKGNPISYVRRGSISSEDGKLLDAYKLMFTKKGFLRKKEITWELFIDAYAQSPVWVAPEGFTLETDI